MTTKPPRQREGKPFPGGKKLRKALAKLQARKQALAASKPRHNRHTPGSYK